MAKQLYRKSLMEKLSSPEQLDKALVITSPMSWLALVGVALIIVVGIIWSVIGTLPTTLDVSGVIALPESTNSFFTSSTGEVSRIYVESGDKVKAGDKLMMITGADGTTTDITAGFDGTISRLLISEGDEVIKGSEVARVTPDVTEDYLVLLYVSSDDVSKLEPGMEVIVTPDFADSQSTGNMSATILNIESYAASTTNMMYVFGEDSMLSSQFASETAVVAVTCRLKTDESSANGFYWTNEKGQQLEISDLSSVTAKIVVDKSAPITLLFTNLKEMLEG